jgi:hypothetical protein
MILTDIASYLAVTLVVGLVLSTLTRLAELAM